MQRHTTIQTQNQEVEVVTYTGTCSQRNLFAESLPTQLLFRCLFIFTQHPDVTGIQKDSTVQVTVNAETIFHVGFHPDISRLVQIEPFRSLCRPESTRSDTACSKRTHTIGASDIELLAVRCRICIAIRPDNSSSHTAGYGLVLIDLPGITEVTVHLQKLCERNTEQFLVSLAELLSENTINTGSYVTGGSKRSLPPDRITHSAQSRVIKSIGIFHCRNKLILQTTVQGFVLISNFLKGLRCVLQHIESHPERCQAVTTDTGRLKVISGISSERQ